MAAQALVKHAKEEIDWLGLHHLERAFREMFCLPGSHMTRSNDFTDRASYILEKVIPEAVSHVRDNSGAAPLRAKRFIFEKLKFNDNSNNEVSLFDPSPKPLLTLCHSIRTVFISLPS
jgi:transcription initiation factor TFIID subunit 2